MSLLKLIIFLSILLSRLTYAQSDLDRYYFLKEDIAKLRVKFRDNQALISKYNTTSNHLWLPSSTKKNIARLDKDQGRILKEMEPKIKEMRGLEQSLEVKAWTYILGPPVQVNILLGDVSQNSACSAKGRQLFTSNEAFEAWNAQNGDLDSKVAYYAKKNGYISHCLGSRDEGAKVDVTRPTSDSCKKIFPLLIKKRARTGKYKLKKEKGEIVLSTDLYFSFKGNDKDKKEAFKKLRETKPCMRNFYARHGIKLNLTFHEQTGFSDWWNSDHSINLYTKYDRPNANNWSTHKIAGMILNAKDRCSIYLHELGHNLGLPDGYADHDCPDRTQIRPSDDIMNNSKLEVKNSQLYPYAIQDILGPLCGK